MSTEKAGTAFGQFSRRKVEATLGVFMRKEVNNFEEAQECLHKNFYMLLEGSALRNWPGRAQFLASLGGGKHRKTSSLAGLYERGQFRESGIFA